MSNKLEPVIVITKSKRFVGEFSVVITQRYRYGRGDYLAVIYDCHHNVIGTPSGHRSGKLEESWLDDVFESFKDCNSRHFGSNDG